MSKKEKNMSIKKSVSNKLQMGWALVTMMVIAALVLSGCGAAQQTKVYHVGILSGLGFVADSTDGFKEGMTALGYIEGRNIVYDVQKTEFDVKAYQTILKKFVADDVDLILAFPTEATIEAKTATKGTKIPVLFTFALVEGMGIIDSVRAPGGNITGVRYPGPDFAVRRFEVLRQIAPNAKRIFVPFQRGYPIVAPQLEVLRPAAQAAGVTLIEFPADNAAELQAEFDARAKSVDVGMDAILFLVEPLAVTPENYAVIAKFAYEHKIPFGGVYVPAENYTDIFGVDVISFESAKASAVLADKIFKGIPAGTIPVLSAEPFLNINYKVAQEFGLTVPDGLLKQANKVIK
jgi:putative tryptophan/tyrosine transport system substrate-binding protein